MTPDYDTYPWSGGADYEIATLQGHHAFAFTFQEAKDVAGFAASEYPETAQYVKIYKYQEKTGNWRCIWRHR